jgi:hypothetical protein
VGAYLAGQFLGYKSEALIRAVSGIVADSSSAVAGDPVSGLKAADVTAYLFDDSGQGN